MSRRLRTRAAVGALMCGSLLLAACADPGNDVEDNSGITTVSFRVWDEAAAGAYRESFDAFTASNRAVHVEIEVVDPRSYWGQLDADAEAGSLPDIFWTDSAHVRRYVDDDRLVSVSEELDADHDEWQPTVVELFTHDDQLWGVPQTWDSIALYYNEELVEEAGVDPADLTWQLELEPEPVEAPSPAPDDDVADTSGDDTSDDAATDDVSTDAATVEPQAPDAATPAPDEEDGPEGPDDQEESDAPEQPPVPPGPRDTLLPAARALTIDSEGRTATDEGFDPTAIVQYGFGAPANLRTTLLPFLAGAGADVQAGDEFSFDSPEGVGAVTYLADLVNVHHVAPPLEGASAENAGSLELFLDGRLAMFQAGTRHLREISEAADFPWGIAPVVAGPAGRVSLVDGVVVVAATRDGEDLSGARAVLGWLGSIDGQLALASQGVALPGATGATGAYLDYWGRSGVDASPFLDAAAGDHISPPVGPSVPARLEAVRPLLGDALRGEVPVPDAVAAAQAAGNAALTQD